MSRRSQPPLALRSLSTFVGLAGAVTGAVWLFLGMRAGMDFSSSCGRLGVVEGAAQCRQSTTFTMTAGVLGGLVMLLLYHRMGLKAGPKLALSLLSAVFLGLGWNFLEYGIDPPTGGRNGIWLVCAVLFAVLAAAPWVQLARRTVPPTATEAAPVAGPLPTEQPDDVETALKTINTLYSEGRITDEEYARATARLRSNSP